MLTSRRIDLSSVRRSLAHSLPCNVMSLLFYIPIVASRCLRIDSPPCRDLFVPRVRPLPLSLRPPVPTIFALHLLTRTPERIIVGLHQPAFARSSKKLNFRIYVRHTQRRCVIDAQCAAVRKRQPSRSRCLYITTLSARQARPRPRELRKARMSGAQCMHMLRNCNY